MERGQAVLFLFLLGCQLASSSPQQSQSFKKPFLSHKEIQLHQATHLVKIFPYPVAGNTSHVEPDTHNPAQGYGNIAGGTGVIRSIQETIENSAKTWNVGFVFYVLMVSSFCLFPYVPLNGHILVSVSLVVLVPFSWFSFAGGAAPVSKWFNGLGVAFVVQALVVAFCDAVSISLALLAAAGGFASGYFNKPANFSWNIIVFFSSALAVNLVYTLLASFIPTPHVAVYWSVLLVVAAALAVALLYLPVKRPLFEGCVIAFFCSYGVVSSFSSILIAFQIQAPFDFVTFFSLPSNFAYNAVSCYVLLLLWAVSTSIGIYVHTLRSELPKYKSSSSLGSIFSR